MRVEDDVAYVYAILELRRDPRWEAIAEKKIDCFRFHTDERYAILLA
jgi:hypothetical protein